MYMLSAKLKTIAKQKNGDKRFSMDKIGIIGVPYNTGSKGNSIERGAEALRKAGIIDVLKQIGDVIDFGDLRVTMPAADNSNPKLLKPNQVEALCKALAFRVKNVVKVSYLPFIVGGDCSAIMGVIEGLRNPNRRLGLVYMDAHGDFNTPETTPSGIIGGMDLAITTGRGPEKLTEMFGHAPLLAEENIVLLGVRDLDFLESKTLVASRVKVFTRQEIRLNGAEKIAQNVLNYLESKCDCVYLHVDLDVLDSSVFSAAGLPVPDGLLKEEFLSIARVLSGSGKLCGLGLMSFDALRDVGGSQAKKLVGLVAEAFGK
jgi:arginase